MSRICKFSESSCDFVGHLSQGFRVRTFRIEYCCNHLLYMKILKQWIWIPMLVAADRVTMSDQTSYTADGSIRFVQMDTWNMLDCMKWCSSVVNSHLFFPCKKIRASLSQSRPTTAGCQPWSCPPFSSRIFQDFSAVALDLCNVNMEN